MHPSKQLKTKMTKIAVMVSSENFSAGVRVMNQYNHLLILPMPSPSPSPTVTLNA